MSLSTYSDYQDLEASEKIGLVTIEASKRLMGWSLYSGSIYTLSDFDIAKVVSIEDSGVALTEVTSVAAVTAGKFYNDRVNQTLYLRTSDSVNPNGKFLALTYRMFFSNVPVTAPHDLSTGFEVDWLPYLKSTSAFGVELDNNNLLGFAIEGSGKIVLFNDQAFWSPIYDKLYFENQRAYIYSWHRLLPITEAKLIYRGKIQGKSYDPQTVSFDLKDILNELRAPVPLDDIEDYPGALIPGSLNNAKQRILYGYLYGHVPTNIDQELDLTGYTLSGTVAVTNGSATVTGTSTSFLTRLSPDDEVLIGSNTETYTVKSVDSATQITLTENYAGLTASGLAIRVKSNLPKRYTNRVHLIAGHALREPSTTVVRGISLTTVELDDATDFRVGDQVYIQSEVFTVSQVSGNIVKFSTAMGTLASSGDSIVVLSVRNVYLGKRLLTYSRDYTYSATNGTITLDGLAEFNVAPVRSVSGTVTFTNASRTVSGSSTFFKKELKPGDWIKRSSLTPWFEILSVDSDTQVTLVSAASYSSTGAADHKAPEIYREGETTLSLDCLGATDDGTTTGEFLKNASQIVRDLLTRAGLEDSLNTASFDDAEGDSNHMLGLAIPEKFNETKPKTLRDVINKINQSVFGSLYQNEDFELAYSILSPSREAGITQLIESDVFKFVVSTDSSRIAKTAIVEYLSKEFEAASGEETTYTVSKTSDASQYLARSAREERISTYLVDEDQAQIMANRWAFLFEMSASTVKIDTALQGARKHVNEKVDFKHEKLFERLGTTNKRKISGISAAKKTVSGVELELSDLANSFSRCAVISDDDTPSYDDSSEDERMFSSYITDSYGMQNNDPDTFGTNLIW